MTVKTDLRCRRELRAKQGDACRDIVGQHPSGGIGNVDAVRAVGLHELRLGEDTFRRDHVRHHQEADRIESELARQPDVLLGDVGLGAMRGDPNRRYAAIGGHAEVVDGSDSGK
jgi:hypothetical protein